MSASIYSWPELQSTETYQGLETPEDKLTVLRGWADENYASFGDDKSQEELQSFDLAVSYAVEGINIESEGGEPPGISNDDMIDRQRTFNRLQLDQAESIRGYDRNITDVLSGRATYNEEAGAYQKYGKDRKPVDLRIPEGHWRWMDEQEKDSLGRLNWITRRTLDLEPHEDSLAGVEVNYAAAALGREQFEVLIDGEGDLSDAEKFRVKKRYDIYKKLAYGDFQDYITSKKVADRPLGTRAVFANDREDAEDMDVGSFHMFLTKDRLSEYAESGLKFDEDRITDEILQLWAVKRGLGDYADYITQNKEESAPARKILSDMFRDALTNHPSTWGSDEVLRKESDGGFLMNPQWLAEGISDDEVRERVEESGVEVPEDVLTGFLRQLDVNRDMKATRGLRAAEGLGGWDARARDIRLFQASHSDKDWDDQTMMSEYLKNTKDPENFWQQIGYGVPTLDNLGALIQTWSSEDAGWFGDAAYGVGNFIRGLQVGAIQDLGMTAGSVIGSAATAMGADTADFLEAIHHTQESVHEVDTIHGKAPRWGRMFGQEAAILGLTAGVSRAGNTIRARKAQQAWVKVSNRKAVKKHLDEFASDITVGEVAAPTSLNAASSFRKFSDKLAGKTYFGLQASRSGGAMYMDAFVKIKRELIEDAGMDPDEAEEIARTSAILPGIGGALITYSMMKLVPGDVMGGIFKKGSNITTANMIKRFKLDRKTWRSAMANPELKAEIVELLGSSFSLKKFLNLRNVQAGVREAAEEFLDEIGQGILTMATYNPELTWAATVSHATEAAFVGSILGGLAGGVAQRTPIVEEQLAPEMQFKLQELELKFNRLREEGNVETAEAVKQASESIKKSGPKVPIVSESDPDAGAEVELGEEGDYFHTPGKFTKNDQSEGRGLRITLEGDEYIIPDIEFEFEKDGKPTYPDLSTALTPDDVVNVMGDERYRPLPINNFTTFVEDNVGTMEQEQRERLVNDLVEEVAKISKRSGSYDQLKDAYEKVVFQARKVLRSDRVKLGHFFTIAEDKVNKNFKSLFVGTALDDAQDNLADYHSVGPEAFPGNIPDNEARRERREATFKVRGWLHNHVRTLTESIPGTRGLGAGHADGQEVAEVYTVALDLAFAAHQALIDVHKGDGKVLERLNKNILKFRQDFQVQVGLWEADNRTDIKYVYNALATIKEFYKQTNQKLRSAFPPDGNMIDTEKRLRGNASSAYRRLMSYAKRSSQGITLPELYSPNESKGLLNDYRRSDGDKDILLVNTSTKNVDDPNDPKGKQSTLHRVYRDRVKEGMAFTWDEGSEVPFIPNEAELRYTLNQLWESSTLPTEEGGDPTPLTKEQFSSIVAESKEVAGLLPADDPARAEALRSSLLDIFWVERELARNPSHDPADARVEPQLLEGMVERDAEILVEKFSKEPQPRQEELKQSAANMFWNAVHNAPDSGQLSLSDFARRVKSHDNSLASNAKGFTQRFEFISSMTKAYREGVQSAIDDIVAQAEKYAPDTRQEVKERLENRLPTAESSRATDVNEIFGWREGDREVATKVGDIVDIYSLESPDTPRSARLESVTSAEAAKVSTKDFWSQKDIGGVAGIDHKARSRGSYFSSKDRKLVVESTGKEQWVAGILKPVASKLTDEGLEYAPLTEKEVPIIFKSAKFAKEAAIAELAESQRPDKTEKVFTLEENGVFRLGGEAVTIEIGASAENTGWSEVPWGDITGKDGYELSLDYGQGHKDRFGAGTLLGRLTAEELESLSNLVDNFLKSSKSEEDKLKAKADEQAIKATRRSSSHRAAEELILPTRVDLKAKKNDLQPSVSRQVARNYLSLSEGVLGERTVVEYVREELLRPDSNYKLAKSQRSPDEVKRQALESTSAFAETLINGVRDNVKRLEAFWGKFLDSGDTSTPAQVKSDPTQYAALMLGTYEMLFDLGGADQHVVVPEMGKLIDKKDVKSQDFVRGVLGRMQDYLLKRNPDAESGFTPLPATKKLPNTVVRRVRAFYADGATDEQKHGATQALHALVGRLVTTKSLTMGTPAVAIERMSELLGMAKPNGENMLKSESRRGTTVIVPPGTPAISEKNFTSYELRSSDSTATVSTKLLKGAATAAIKAVTTNAQGVWKSLTARISAERSKAAEAIPEKITWHKTDTTGVYISGSSAFNSQKTFLANQMTEDFWERFRGAKVITALRYDLDSGNFAKDTEIDSKKKVALLIGHIKDDPKGGLNRFIKPTSEFAKDVRARLKGYQDTFGDIDAKADEGVELHRMGTQIETGKAGYEGHQRAEVYGLYTKDEVDGTAEEVRTGKGRDHVQFAGSLSMEEFNSVETEIAELRGQIKVKKDSAGEERTILEGINARKELDFRQYKPGPEVKARLERHGFKTEGKLTNKVIKSILGGKQRGSRAELIYKLEGGDKVELSLRKTYRDVNSLENEVKAKENFLEKNLKEGLGGVKRRASEKALEAFVPLIEGTAFSAGLYINAAEDLIASIKKNLIGLARTRPPVHSVHDAVKAEWEKAALAISADLGSRLVTLRGRPTVVEQMNNAKNNIQVAAGYEKTLERQRALSVGGKDLKDAFVPGTPDISMGFYKSTNTLDTRSHVRELDLKQEQVPLTSVDVVYSNAPEGGKNISVPRNLTVAVIEKNAKREAKLVPKLTGKSYIVRGTIPGSTLASNKITARSPVADKLYKEEDGRLSYSKFLEETKDKKWSAVDSYFYVVSEKGGLKFTNHPFHMAAYFSKATTNSEGVTTFPGPIKVPKGYGDGKGQKKLHPGLILDKKKEYIIGAGTHFPPSLNKPDWIGPRYNAVSYVKAHTTTDERGNSIGGFTLVDVQSAVTPSTTRESRQVRLGEFSAETEELTAAINALDAALLDRDPGGYNRPQNLLAYEVEFLYDILRNTKEKPSKVHSGKEPVLKFSNFKRAQKGGAALQKEIRDEKFNLNLSQYTLKNLVFDAYQQFTKKDEGEYLDDQIAEAVKTRSGEKVPVNWESRFTVHVALSLVKTRMLADASVSSPDATSGSKSILQRFEEDADAAWDYLKNRDVDHIGNVLLAEGQKVLTSQSSTALFPSGGFKNALVAIVEIEAKRRGQHPLKYLLGKDSPIKVFKSSEFLSGTKTAMAPKDKGGRGIPSYDSLKDVLVAVISATTAPGNKSTSFDKLGDTLSSPEKGPSEQAIENEESEDEESTNPEISVGGVNDVAALIDAADTVQTGPVTDELDEGDYGVPPDTYDYNKSIASAIFGPHTPFDGLTEKTREEMATRVYEELNYLGVKDGDADSLRVALFKIKEGALEGVYPQHYAELVDILLKSGKIDFDNLSLVVTNRIMEAGHYNPRTNTIALNSEATNPRGVQDVIIHELFHVAFDKVLSDPRSKNHKLVIEALDALIDKGRAFYETGQVNRMGAQKRAEFQAKREANNYSLEVIKGLVSESSSLFIAELSSDPTPSEYREVYRNIRAEELGANKYFDDAIQLRHAFSIKEDGTYKDQDPYLTRSEFFAHLVTDETTQWYMKEIDRVSPLGSIWDGTIRTITRGIADEDETDFADELVGAFLSLTGNEKYRDLGATRTLQEVMGHTEQDLNEVDDFRATAPVFSPDFNLDNLNHNISSEASKALDTLGADSPAKNIISAFNIQVDTKGSVADPEVSAVPGVINLPLTGMRERKVVATTIASAYEAVYTPGERVATMTGFLSGPPETSEFLLGQVAAAGSWENLVGEIVADAFYGDQKSDFESQIQSLRAEVLSRTFGFGAARHVEELLERLGEVVPEKRSFIRENYFSEEPAHQFSSRGYVGDKIVAERAVEKHNLSIAPDDYVSIKEELESSDLNFEEYLNQHVADEDTRNQFMVVEGEMLLQLEEYSQNPDPDERAVVGLQRVISGLPHDATIDDILASKTSEAFKAGGKKAGEAVRGLADEISNKGKKFLKPKFVGKIWGTLKKLKNPLTVDLDPTTGLTEKPPTLEHKRALGVYTGLPLVPGFLGGKELGHHLRLDGFLRMLTVPGKGGKLAHEETKQLRGNINETVTKAQLLTSAINKQIREQYGVNSLGELAETWDSAEWAETWGLSAGVNAGAHLAKLINRTLGEKDDKILVDEFGPTSPPGNFTEPIWSELTNEPGLTLRERVVKWRDTHLQAIRSKASGQRKGIRIKYDEDPANRAELIKEAKDVRSVVNSKSREVRDASASALTALYVEAAGNFRVLQDSALEDIVKLDEAYLASKGRAGETKTPANSLSASLKEMRGAINKLQRAITGSNLLEQTFGEAIASSGPDSIAAQLYAADGLFKSMQIKIGASNNIHLTTTYQLNDEKKNYMRWLGSTEPEARRRYKLIYGHFKNVRLNDKAKKLAKRNDYEVADALRMLKLESEPIPHNEIVGDVRRFVQSFGSAGVETSALGLMNVKTLTPKKDIASPLQEGAGAYQDNIFNAARTLTTLGTLQANHDYLTSIKEMLGRLEKEANEGKGPNDPEIVLLSDEAGHRQHGLIRFAAADSSGGNTSGNFGPLEGMYGPPLLVRALQDVSRKNYAGIQKQLMWVASNTMANVTTRRPRTHVRNFVGNPMFLVNAGMPLHAIKGFRILTDWIHGGEGAGSAVMKAAMVGAKDQIEALPTYKGSSKTLRLLSPALKNALALFIAKDSSRFLGKTSVFEPEMMAIMEEYAEFLVTGQDVRSNVIQEARKNVLHAGGGDPIFGLSMVPSSKARGVWKNFGGIDKFLEGMYGAEDDYWKATAYEGQLTKLANVFGLSKVDAEERYAPFTLRKRVGQMLDGKYEGAMTPKQANQILDTFKPRTEEQRTKRAELLKDDRRSAALYTLKAEAAYRVQETMPNYSMTVELVKWMKRNQLTAYVAPFISFYAETLRLSIKTPLLAIEEMNLGRKTKNMKLMQMGANRAAWSGGTLYFGSKAMQGLFSLLGAMLGMDDDENKDLTAAALAQDTGDTDDIKALKRFLHEWYQKGTLAFFGDAEGGFPIMMDVSHMMPLASPVDSIRRLFEGISGERETTTGFLPSVQEFGVDMFGQFFQPQMWAQAITGGRYQAKNTLSELDSKLWDPLKSIGGEMGKIAVPGYMYDAFKLAIAVRDRGKVVRGQQVSLSDEFLSSIFGVNIKRIDIREEFERKLGKRAGQLRDSQAKLRWMLRGNTTVSEEEVMEEVETYRKESREYTLRLIRDFESARHFIGDEADIIMSNKLDKNLLSQVYGRYHELAPVSSTTADTAYRVADEINNPERLIGLDALYETPVESFEQGEIMKVLER